MKYRRFTLNEVQVDLLNRILELPENSVSELSGRLSLDGYELEYLREMRDYFSGSKARTYAAGAWFDMREYPAGWKALYSRWKNGEITPREFMTESGLRPMAFFDALTDYMDEIGDRVDR